MADFKKLLSETKENLLKELQKQQKELADKKIMVKIGKEKDTSQFTKMRKDIARIHTVLNQKGAKNE